MTNFEAALNYVGQRNATDSIAQIFGAMGLVDGQSAAKAGAMSGPDNLARVPDVYVGHYLAHWYLGYGFAGGTDRESAGAEALRALEDDFVRSITQ